MKASPTTAQRARINVKLAAGVSHEEVDTVLSGTPGLQSVVQLFPDERDEDMRCMYMLEVAPDRLDAAVEQLRRNPHVESAHETAPRKLIW